MKVQSGHIARGLILLIGAITLLTAPLFEEPTVLTIIGISLIAIGVISFIAHSVLSRKNYDKKFILFVSIALLGIGCVTTALTDWSPSNTPVPSFLLIYAGAGLLLSLPGRKRTT